MNAKEAREMTNASLQNDCPIIKDLVEYALSDIEDKCKLGLNSIVNVFEGYKGSVAQKIVACKILSSEPYNFKYRTIAFQTFIYW